MTKENTVSKKNPNTVELSTPIKVGDTKITSVTLRKPKAGELRGLSIAEILHMNVTAMIKLLPRISTPVLDPQVIEEMDTDNFGPLSQKAMSFFLPKAQQEKMRRMAEANS